ncbi:ABC transporter permease subunit [uncultured Clostridium sp.]|uniref:ABC transporter permease subunit n=1 Tax=uncultured Clostridium sp. TaxID=59620 RepID=UPI002620515C|nr:ABC transporter permease subunit [uncultured Clostridium sp.]
MFTLIKNEYIKLFKRTKTLVIIGLLLLGAAGLTFMLYKSEQQSLEWRSPEKRIEIEKQQIEYEKKYINDLKTEQKNLKTQAEKDNSNINIEQSKQYIKDREAEIKRLEDEIKNPIDWRVTTKEEIKDIKGEIAKIKEDIASGEIERQSQLTYYTERLEELEYYSKKDLKPIESWEFYPGFSLIQVSSMLCFLIPLFIAIFGNDIVSDEATNETFKFLLIQPVKRGKILLAKFITLITSVFLLLFGVQGIIFTGIGAVRGFADLDQLVKVGQRYEINQEILIKQGNKILDVIPGTGEFITYGDLVLRSLAMQAIFIFACCTVVFLFSTICKSNMISAAASVVVIVGGAVAPYMISQLGELAHLSFLSYGATAQLLMGDLNNNFTNPDINYMLGIGLMLGVTIIAYIISHINFSKKDILV